MAAGHWISSCYGPAPAFNSQAVASVADRQIAGNGTAGQQELRFRAPTAIDRVMIQEDIAHGQRTLGC